MLVNNLKPQEVLLIENTRYEDYPNKLESNCDEELSKYWASLGDIFINDAYGTCHRAHASNVGIAKILPNATAIKKPWITSASPLTAERSSDSSVLTVRENQPR